MLAVERFPSTSKSFGQDPDKEFTTTSESASLALRKKNKHIPQTLQLLSHSNIPFLNNEIAKKFQQSPEESTLTSSGG